MRMMEGVGVRRKRILPNSSTEEKVKITNRVALVIIEWVAQMDVKPEDRRINFTGMFRDGRIKENGPLMNHKE